VGAVSPNLILVHKQGSSARVRFLRLSEGVLFLPLPSLSVLREEGYAPAVRPQPADVLRQAEERLGLATGSIAIEGEFHAWVDTPGGDVPVFLAAFTTLDPPFAAAERVGGKFISITEARGLPQVELRLLLRTYEYLIG
jgi:hypothetical protein